MRTGRLLIWRFSVCVIIICSLAVMAAQAQDSDEAAHPPISTIYGNTGLWKVFSADNLPKYQASFNVWYDRINRNPGWLTLSTTGVSGAVGITDWLEFGMNFDINTHILARRQDQLSFGQQALGFFGAGTPNSPPFPYELVPSSTIIPMLHFPGTRAGIPNGRAGYYNDLPWIGSNLESNGVGPVTAGFKLNALSEEKGDPLGLSFRVFAVIPTHSSAQFLLSRPTQTGGWSFGSNIILTKYLGDMAELDLNAGYQANRSPADGTEILLADEVPLGFAFIIPRKTRLQLTSETTADVFIGDHTPVTTFGARDPMDFTIGGRAWLTRNLVLSGGYRRPVNQYGGDKNGFVFDLSYGTTPAKKAPPQPITLTCSADPSQVNAGGIVNLSAQAVVPGGGAATYEWSTTGGTIDGSGATVKVRTENLAPGSYSATVKASDGPQTAPASCTAQFAVAAPPPMHPPTVTLSADRTRVQVGEIVHLTAVGQSPDNRPLTYSWQSSGGRVEGSGTATIFDTTGLSDGPYTISVKDIDDRNLSSDPASVTITVFTPPAAPKASANELGTCQFGPNSARVDNVCKQELDRDTSSLQGALASDPAAKLTVVGSAGSQERNSSQLAEERANNIRAYLVNFKGLKDSQVEARSGGEGGKADIWLVPGGASFETGTVENAPIPEACVFEAKSSRVAGDCKTKLDAVAASLKNEAGSKLVVVGFAERTEGGAALAHARAASVKAYLVRQKIAGSRITVRPERTENVGGDRKNPRNDLRRADFYLIPSGGTMSGENISPAPSAASHAGAAGKAPAKESSQLLNGGRGGLIASSVARTKPFAGEQSPAGGRRVIIAQAE